MSMPNQYYEQSTRRLRDYFVPVICFVSMLLVVGGLAAAWGEKLSTPRQHRSLKCEKDGVTFFKGTVTVETGDGQIGFLKLISDDGRVCRLFEHTDPVK